jgi:predicted N-acyltransferase
VSAACQVRIVHDLEQLPDAQWHGLVSGNPALRLEVLRAIARYPSRPLSLQVFLLEDQLGLAGAALCVTIGGRAAHNPLDALLFGRAAPLLRRLGVSTRPVLIFQNPLLRQASVVLRPGTAAVQQRLLDQLLDGIENYAAEIKAGIAFMGVTPEDTPLWAMLRRRGYPGSEFDSTARLDIRWSDFDSYVNHLRQASSNAAKIARNERNRNRKSGVNIRQLTCTEQVAQALYTITRDHYHHKNGHDPVYGPQFLPQLAKTLGDDLLVFEAVRGGERVAMLAVVRAETVGWVAWVGIELQDRPNDFTYANIVFYHPSDWAPTLGLKTLVYGNVAQAAKSRRGCRLLPCGVFYRPRRRVYRLLARPCLALHQSWFQRKRD